MFSSSPSRIRRLSLRSLHSRTPTAEPPSPLLSPSSRTSISTSVTGPPSTFSEICGQGKILATPLAMAMAFTNLCPWPGLHNSNSVTKRPPICHYGTRRYTRQLKNKQMHRFSIISYKSGAEQFETNFINEKEDDIHRSTLIWRAVKLPIYSVALVPLTVGSAAAYLQTGLYSAKRYLVLLASSVLVVTWLNLSNDVYDFDTGADKNKKESVVNLLGSRTGTLISAYILLAIGFIGLIWISLTAGSIRSILLLVSAITCGYIYQCPPFRLSYKGLGEPLCFAAFGPFATTAFYLMQSSTSELPITGMILSASLLVGFTTTLILFCSHFHQINEDTRVGKMSPLVRIGTETGSKVVKVAVILIYYFLFVFGLVKALPLTSVLLGILTLPIGKLVVNYVDNNHKDKTKIFMAKYYCVRLHAVFGAALAAGLVVAAKITNTNFAP